MTTAGGPARRLTRVPAQSPGLCLRNSARVFFSPLCQLAPLFGKFEPRLGLKRRWHPFRFLFALDCFLATQTHFVVSGCRIGGDLRRNLKFLQRRLNWRRSRCAAPPSRRCIELGIVRAKFRALNRCTHTTPFNSAPSGEDKGGRAGVPQPTRPLITRSPGVQESRSATCDDCVSSRSS
jgi:hypothetical protein